MPKIVDTNEIKSNIIKNAFKVFVDKGYYKTSMSDITSSCNMKRTTIYHYFNNKNEIFENMIYYILDIIEEDIKDLINDKGKTHIEKIKNLHRKWDKELGNKKIILLLFELSLTLNREDDEIFSRIRTKIKEKNKIIGKLVLENIKDKHRTKKEQIELLECSIIISVLQQLATGSGFISDSLLSFL